MHTKSAVRMLVFASLSLALICAGYAEEQPGLKVAPEKVAQLKRMEPLNKQKVNVLFESGQLTQAQGYPRLLGSGGFTGFSKGQPTDRSMADRP